MAEPTGGFDTTEEPAFEELTDRFLGSDTQPASEKKKPTGVRSTPLEKKLEKFYGGIGMAVFGFDQHCGQVIISNAGSMAASLDQLAKQNPEVRKLLERLMETSAYGLVIAAHAPVVFAIALHHSPKMQELTENVGARMAAKASPDFPNGIPTDWVTE